MNDLARTINIDVTGMSMSLPEITVPKAGDRIRFVVERDRKAGMAVHLAAYFSKSVLSREVFDYPRAKRFAVLTESPIDVSYREIDEVVRRFPLIYTHQRTLLARGQPFRRLLFGTNWLGARDEETTRAIVDSSPEKVATVSFIGSLEHPDEGPYRFRRQVAQHVLGRGDVECFGKGIRPIAGKMEAIAPFRFSIAMENAAADDYFSEKLVDCLLLETVPIYYGAPGIASQFDPRGMLCFSTIEELDAILDRVNPGLYEQMRPFALANKKKAVAERWHNHAGLFARLAEALPEDAYSSTARLHGSANALSRTWRRLGLPGA